MNDKLELKHLASYLPYKVKIQSKVVYGKINKPKEGVVNTELTVGNIWSFIERDSYYEYKRGKLILRPLDELSMGCEYLCGMSFVDWACVPNYEDKNLKDLKEWILGGRIKSLIMDALLRNHFDVFGLIDKGLAIDINTLDK